jgi:heptosyltransferase-1
VQRSRELAARALGYSVGNSIGSGPDFGLHVPGAQSLQPHTAIKNIAFVHGTSRADKEWPIQHWVELGGRLITSGYRIVLVHGSASEQATSQAIGQQLGAANCVVWPQMALDELTRQLAQCAGVIGVDSGVSHIAVALGLPHVQMYNFDTAWRTGPVSSEAGATQLSVFAQPAPGVDAVWQAWLACSGGLS